mgnify:CR=1 FL=1
MSAASIVADAGTARSPWLFSRGVDLATFLGSALLALGLLWVGWLAGVLNSDTPDWVWIPCVLLVDVAHVYSTSLRVYLDRDELARRPLLYTAVPVFGLAAALVRRGLAEFMARKRAVADTDDVKFNVNLTLLDFFVRWGLVADPDGSLRAGLDQGPD